MRMTLEPASLLQDRGSDHVPEMQGANRKDLARLRQILEGGRG